MSTGPNSSPVSDEKSVLLENRLKTTWSSLRLYVRARDGDQSAISALFVRNFRPLLRWAHGRLPHWARGLADTADLVQDVMLQTFQRLDRFEPRGQRALQAYLRQSIHNRIRDELRRVGRTPSSQLVDSSLLDRSPSPLHQAMDQEAAERYKAALARLVPGDRELIVGRFELEYSYDQLALATRRRTPDAARMAVKRALVRLAHQMAGT
jgi:RNA polymerase sigma factor (sigma-70 family)